MMFWYVDLEIPASLLLALERFDESKAEFAKLLEANADNYEYHTGLQCAHCKIVEKRENRRPTAKAVVTCDPTP